MRIIHATHQQPLTLPFSHLHLCQFLQRGSQPLCLSSHCWLLFHYKALLGIRLKYMLSSPVSQRPSFTHNILNVHHCRYGLTFLHSPRKLNRVSSLFTRQILYLLSPQDILLYWHCKCQDPLMKESYFTYYYIQISWNTIHNTVDKSFFIQDKNYFGS